ncbi:transcription termination factor 2 [Pelodytes ibericus]
MDRVRCTEHGNLCFLKTGTRDGPNKGKSFYVCGASRAVPCIFTQPADVPVSHCLLHEEYVVELQALLKQDSGVYRLFYRCVKSKSDGKKWCGNVPWQGSNLKQNPFSQPPGNKPEKKERNPFKVLNEDPKCAVWKQISGERKSSSEEEKIPKRSGGDKKSSSKEEEEEVRDKNLRHRGEDKKSSSKEEEEEVRDKDLRHRGEDKKSNSEEVRDKDLRHRGEDKKSSSKEEEEEVRDKDLRHRGEDKKSNSKEEEEEEVRDKDLRHRGEDKKSSSKEEEIRDKDQKRNQVKVKEKPSPETHGIPNGERSQNNMGTSDPWEVRASFQTWREKDLPAGVKVKKKVPERAEGRERMLADTVGGSRSAAEGGSDYSKANTQGHCMAQEMTEPHRGVTDRAADMKDTGLSDGRIAGAEDGEEDVVFVSSQPGKEKHPEQRISSGGKQRTITSFPGFSAQPVSHHPAALHAQLTAQLQQRKATLASVNLKSLPDKGERLLKQVQDLEDALGSLNLSTEGSAEQGSSQDGTVQTPSDPRDSFNRHGPTEASKGVKPLSFHELSSQGLHAPERPLSSSQNYSNLYGVTSQWQSLYGGRMTEDRLSAVRNATSDTIDHLHKSLESCPSPESTAEDPAGLKVPLLLHQKQALAWLAWREAQKPQGGILADDMGLGKTLTMVALILMQKQRQKREEEKKLEIWISKTDSSLTVSRGTLIICPASLVHHWKKEVERRVCDGNLRVYLYHGPNREKDSKVLAQYDIVVTTYSLLSKEIPVKKGEGDVPAKDQDLEDKAAAASPLLRLAWARVVLDEAHNIKNPKVQTSIAVCKLRAGARWAVTGTPIQNNLLDMYSLLRFLRCSPFDEFKLWKNQVDNGSRKGGERLNILTKSLLLRRTKDQLDHMGRPLVLLPQRRCELHRLTLSAQEQSVYDVIFARSRSTLQSYLKRHEGGGANTTRGGDNPFDRVAREFGACDLPSSAPPQGSSTVHILSLLLRLRQCCCHLSLLKVTLEQLELKSEGLTMSLEEQLNALSLCELQTPDPKSTVSLNGANFPAKLFETESKSTKIDSLLSELRSIGSTAEPQKSVIVSQWTSMLKVVAVHLKSMGLSYATIDGSVSPKLRMDLVEDFNCNPRGPQVMLVSLCAGGVGLNLIGGNHLFLLDMHWNPALEDQACDRIYRVGQCKDVVIHRFVCLGTVEEKITQLQEKKKELANKVLSGNSSTFTKLTLADLRLLFGV